MSCSQSKLLLDNGCFNADVMDSLLEVEIKVEVSQSTASDCSEFVSPRSLRGKRKTVLSTSETSDNYDDSNDGEDCQEKDEDEFESSDTVDYTPSKPKRKYKSPKKVQPKQLGRFAAAAREHDKIIKKYMKLKCDLCSVDLVDFNDLQKHFKTIHKCKGYVMCCNKKLINRRKTADHINAHNNPDHFKCQECGKFMSDKSSMERHMLAFHSPDDLKTFPCLDCPQKFASQYLLDRHSAKHVPKEKCAYVCKDCGHRYPNISLLNNHIKLKHFLPYDIMCEICAKLFKHKSVFERHMQEHNGIVAAQVQCEECGTWLKNKYIHKKHLKDKHNQEEHICNICGHQSTSKSALQSHINYMHEITNSFECTFCEKSFKKAIKLKEHVATHTGEKLYSCPYCPTKFCARSNFHYHRKKVHREEWEKTRRFLKKLTIERIEILEDNILRVNILSCLDEELEKLIGEVVADDISDAPTPCPTLSHLNSGFASVNAEVKYKYKYKYKNTKNEQNGENDSSEDEEDKEGSSENGQENDSYDEVIGAEQKETEQQELKGESNKDDKEIISSQEMKQESENEQESKEPVDEDDKEITSNTDEKLCLSSEVSEKLNQNDNDPRSKKFLYNMKTKKENDAFIRKHMKLTCEHCQIDFDDFTKLKNHFRLVHKSEGYAVCCDRQLKKRSTIVDHIFVHIDPEYFKCKDCGKVLSDRSCLHRHMILSHQTEESKNFLCSKCPKKFPTKKQLDVHIVTHNECTHKCEECGKKFPTKMLMETHCRRIHSTLCDRMCEICAKLIKGKTNFLRHMEEHEGKVQPKVQCNECGSWFKHKNSLRKHTYSKHNEKTHVCKVCGKIAVSYSALYSHMKYMHELSNDYSCSFCDKSFKMAIKLKEHVATHEGGFLYECPHCPSTFNAKTNMHSHRKKAHPEEWEANKRYGRKTP